MSLLGNIVGAFQAPLQENTELVTFVPYRAIGGFTAMVTISEEHFDDMVTTDHPVEQGANVSDHAFKLPAQLQIKCGWSNSGNQYGDPFYVQKIYQQLLDLQASRMPFQVFTGKRLYENMLFCSLGVTTEADSENSLHLTAQLKQLNFAQIQTLTLPPVENQAMPEKTAEPVNNGTKQPKTSDLYNAVNGE